MGRFECHSHTMYSNLRLVDSTIFPRKLVEKAIELGLAGIAITDHESLSAHVEIDRLMQEYAETNPDFKIARGNEIYLVDERTSPQQYFHFILIAKDAIGHKMLRELSSNAWLNSYVDRGMTRVPTLKSELRDIIEKYGHGHLIGSTACLGSELDVLILKLDMARKIGDKQEEAESYRRILEFVGFCKSIFDDDFYLEVQPGRSNEQLIVNSVIANIGKSLGIKIIVTTDAHYLTKNDRYTHKALLTSKDGEREIDSFYEFAYLQPTEDVIKNLDGTGLDYYELEANTLEIYNKIDNYSLARKQHVTQVDVPIDYPAKMFNDDRYPTLQSLFTSDNPQERYWVNQCTNKMLELGIYNDTYLERLEYEADINKDIGEKLETCLFAYPIFLQHYIDLFWECGSPIGAGRGSAGAGLNHYLLGITQTDPIKTNSPYWRFLNKERLELPDIDIDLAPSKREAIFDKIREERGELGCVQVCNFGTASTKSAIQTACRGYRTPDYPNGIDNDEAMYLSSLVPSERGFLWPISDVINGNKEKGRKPNTTFINKMKQYPGLLDIIIGIEGLVVSRGIHASGVNFYGDDPYETACFMKSKSGALTTQYSLRDAEFCGDVKIDMLVTEQMDIMAQCIKLLQEHGYFDKNLTLREAYDKYVHPNVIPVEDDKLWDAIDEANILALFQLNTTVGSNIVKQLQPRSVEELSACNGLMRLSGEEGKERPADRYARLKSDISQWYDEMDALGITKDEQAVLEKYMKTDYGAPSSQEVLMMILMDKDTCGFSLAEGNEARKIIAKKAIDKIPQLKQKILDRAKRPVIGQYIWDNVIMPQASYSFSRIHGYSYSLIGCQAAYLATYYPSIYWNTAYLRVVSGLDSDDTTNYEKTAIGVGDIISKGCNVSLVDINRSGYWFEPDEKNDSIMYGLKAVRGVKEKFIDDIFDNRPYNSFEDFMSKCSVDVTGMVSLIKAGAFNAFGSREEIMSKYLYSICGVKNKLNMQNMNGIINYGLVPSMYDEYVRMFIFNKALKANCKHKDGFIVENEYYAFFEQMFDIDELEAVDGRLFIRDKKWKKLYDKGILPLKKWLSDNEQEVLAEYNRVLFNECWNKYATGSLADWEMDSLCFYYSEHPLKNVDNAFYNICEFNSLPETPIVEHTINRGDFSIPVYKTVRICGTVIADDDVKSTVSIITPGSGVVNVKFGRDYYAQYKKQISTILPDGTKKVIEKGWFTRGVQIVVNGFRRQNQFVAKKYKNTESHQLYKIQTVYPSGMIDITNDRSA